MTAIIIRSNNTDLNIFDKQKILDNILFTSNINELTKIEKYIHATQPRNKWEQIANIFYSELATEVFSNSDIALFTVSAVNLNGLLQFLSKIYPTLQFEMKDTLPTEINQLLSDIISVINQGNMDLRVEIDNKLSIDDWEFIESQIKDHPKRHMYDMTCFWCDTHETWEFDISPNNLFRLEDYNGYI